MYYEVKGTFIASGPTEADAIDRFEAVFDLADVRGGPMQALEVIAHEGDFTPQPAIDRLAIMRKAYRRLRDKEV